MGANSFVLKKIILQKGNKIFLIELSPLTMYLFPLIFFFFFWWYDSTVMCLFKKAEVLQVLNMLINVLL